VAAKLYEARLPVYALAELRLAVAEGQRAEEGATEIAALLLK
jgi:hypothetical protein